jgi:hypothetical protein
VRVPRRARRRRPDDRTRAGLSRAVERECAAAERTKEAHAAVERTAVERTAVERTTVERCSTAVERTAVERTAHTAVEHAANERAAFERAAVERVPPSSACCFGAKKLLYTAAVMMPLLFCSKYRCMFRYDAARASLPRAGLLASRNKKRRGQG